MSPSYKNIGKNRKEIFGKMVEPNQVIGIPGYIDEIDKDIVKISDKPYYNPNLVSKIITKEEMLQVPLKDSNNNFIIKYAIHFAMIKGKAEIKYNNPDNNPALVLYEGAKWNIRTFERNIDKILIKGITEIFELCIIIEKI